MDTSENITTSSVAGTISPGIYPTASGCGNLTGHFAVCYEEWHLPFILLIAFIIIITIFGNTLTLVAIISCKSLRTTANLLVISLAISDLTVAVGVMPLSLLKELTPAGTLGHPLCDIWVSLDVLCCTASILNLCVIALDRFWSISYPFSYNDKRTPRRMLMMISAVWVLSTTISIAPLLGWKTPKEKQFPSCQVSQDKYYTIFSTFGAFFIPMTIMLVVYWLIFLEARRRIRGKSLAKYVDSSLQTLNGSGSQIEDERERYHMRALTNSSIIQGRQNQHAALMNGLRDETLLQPDSVKSDPTLNAEAHTPRIGKKTRATSLPISKQSAHYTALKRFQAEKQAMATAREQKAAKTLAIVTGIFLICWLPFFSLALLIPFCNSCQIPRWFQSVALWLGYFNSMLNPPIYTMFNPEFQKAFHRTLRCRTSLN